MNELLWRRLHPLSPLLRSGRVLLGLTAALVPQAASNGPIATLVIFAALLPLLLGGAYLSWRRTKFTVDGPDLRVESGVLLHRSRRVPLARVQAVDIVRPLVGRALGLAELRLEVVGGGRSEAPLAFLREGEAAALRLELLSLGRGETPRNTTTADSAVPADTTLVVVPAGALIGSTFLDGRTLIPAFVLLAVLVSAVLLPPAALGAMAATFLTFAVAAFEVIRRRLLVEWGFTVSDGGDGLILRHGLLETRTQTVPAGRVQGVRVIEPLLWRRRGWVRVEVDVAGYGGGGTAQLQTSTLLPVAPKQLAAALVARVLGGEPPVALLTSPPRRARWLDPLSLPVLGVAFDETFVVTRSGWLRRDTAIVPLAKVQGMRLVQGPIERRLALSTLHLATAGRDIHAVALHRDASEAAALLDKLTGLARAQRRSASIAS